MFSTNTRFWFAVFKGTEHLQELGVDESTVLI